jgi:hypothetical protein
MGVPYSIFCCFKSTTEARLIDLEAGGTGTYSTDVNTMLASANNAAIRSAIGLGQTDAPTFLGLALTGTTDQLLKINAGNWIGTDSSQVYLYSSGYGAAVVSLNNGGGALAMRSDWTLGWTNSGTAAGTIDIRLARDAAGILAQRNGTNAQAFRVYNTTDAGITNYERVNLEWSGGQAILQTVKGGTGAARDLILRSNANLIFGVANGGQWFVHGGTANFCAFTDNTFDIGSSGANRPRNLYLSGSTISVGYFRTTRDSGIIFASSATDPLSGTHLTLRASANAVNTLCIGDTTSAFPAIKRNGTGIDIRLADDSTYAPLTAASLSLGVAVPTADLDIAKTWNMAPITVTGASGTGTVVTLTFATQSTAIPIGSTIVVANIGPAGYNGTYVVTASSVTSVSYLNATTASYASVGTIERLFTSVKLNVTDTASNAASLLMDLQVGGVSKFKFDKTGVMTTINVYAGGAVGYALFNDTGLGLRSAAVIGWTAGIAVNAQDTILARDAAGILAQRNGTNAQAFRVYNTYDTAGANYDRLSFFHAGGQATIATEGFGANAASSHLTLAAGGTTRSIFFQTAGSAKWLINSAGNFLAQTHNTYDIGAVGGVNCPRNIFVAQTVRANAFQLNATSHVYGTVDGIIGLYNSALNNFDRLQLGGTTSAFPAIKRNGTGIEIRLADDSNFAPLSSGALTIAGGGANITGIVNGTAFISGFYIQTNTQFMFGTGGVGDVALQKNATGVVEINSTTAGTFRDLRVRSVIQQPPASITPASNGDLVVEATSNTLLTFKFKGSDGTVRSGTMVVA